MSGGVHRFNVCDMYGVNDSVYVLGCVWCASRACSDTHIYKSTLGFQLDLKY